MKQIEVRVNDGLEDIVYYKDKPYLLDQLSFVRDEKHNCQMIVYAIMTPLDMPELHLTPSFIDDMEAQNSPDVIGVCATCEEFIFDGDMWVKTLEKNRSYCSEKCYEASDDFPLQTELICDICDKLISECEHDVFGSLYG